MSLQNFDVQNLLILPERHPIVTGQTQRPANRPECGVPETAYTGQQYTIGTGTLTVLLPGVDADTAGSAVTTSDMSLCLRFGAGKFTARIPASRAQQEAALASNIRSLGSTVFKAGHHGSSTSTPKHCCGRCSPQLGFASCGLNNDYSHPHRGLSRKCRMGALTFTCTAQ